VSGGIAPRILNLGNGGGEWSASHPGRFYPRGKSLPYSLDRRLGGPQNRSWRGGEGNKSHHCLAENRTPVVQTVA